MNRDQETSAQGLLKRESQADFEKIRNVFADAGFSVGPLVANNFSISGSVEKFERFFGVRMESSADGMRFISGDQTLDELSTDDLPNEIRGAVEKVLLTRLPAFGPFNP